MGIFGQPISQRFTDSRPPAPAPALLPRTAGVPGAAARLLAGALIFISLCLITTSTLAQDTPTADQPPPIPPEVWQALTRQQPGIAPDADPELLSAREQLLIGLLAAACLLGGAALCRAAHRAGYLGHSPLAAGLLFGLFTALAALCLTHALLGVLRLHIAAGLSVLASGYCLGALWLGQTPFLQRFLAPNKNPDTRDRQP